MVKNAAREAAALAEVEQDAARETQMLRQQLATLQASLGALGEDASDANEGAAFGALSFPVV